MDDMLALLITGRGCTHSSNLFISLSGKNIPVVFCNANYAPAAWLMTLDGNYMQSKRMQSQAQVKLPIKKRLWRDIVIAKLKHQAKVLEVCCKDYKPLIALSKTVSSGDLENVEAQGAKYYWRELFSSQFSRDRTRDGINALLNYGYTIVRACVARAVSSSGLHPTLGIHHKGPSNSMCLVDDLIEPYRPIVDYLTWQITNEQAQLELTKEIKAKYCRIALDETQGEFGSTPIFTSCQKLANSLVNIYIGNSKKLELFSLEESYLKDFDNLFISSQRC